jgi:hypothetical protein
LQLTGPLLQMAGPSAQLEKCVQQPAVPQSQVPGSTNTEWQSARASQSASVVCVEQGGGQMIAGQECPAMPEPQPM